jgi:hypothetical protein
MKKLSFIPAMLAILVFGLISPSCTKTNNVVIDTAAPQGAFTPSRSGSIAEQNNTGSKGTVQLGKDSKSNDFIKFGSDFTTVLATGTVTVYLSTSNTYKADPGKGNPDLKLVGLVNKNGEMYIKLSSAVESKFTHLILWCGSANIPFGVAELK